MTMTKDLLADIERFLKRHDMKPTTFGKAAAKNGNLVFDLRLGHSMTLRVVERVKRFMEEYGK